MHTSYSYSSYSSFFYLNQDDQPLPSNPTTISIPIHSPSAPTSTPIPVRLPGPTAAAVRIQSAFRAHLVRSLVREIRAVKAEAAAMERVIRLQETVDAVRRDARERARVAEALMALLLRLDAVPGVYPPVRELRRAATRRVVALQEVLDAVLAAPEPAAPEGFPGSWDEFVEKITGGEEEDDDKEAAEELRSWEKKGFDCLERFLLGV